MRAGLAFGSALTITIVIEIVRHIRQRRALAAIERVVDSTLD